MMKLASAAFATALLAVAAAVPAVADTTPPLRTITVTGEGAASAPPDMATISIGVDSVGKTAAEALAANNDGTSAVIKAVKEAGVASADIQTSDFSVNPRYADRTKEDGSLTVVGYQVTNAVTVKIRDLGKMGELLDTVVGVGANRINGISFGFVDPVEVADSARKEAVADAVRKANLFAEAAGVTLGAIQQMGETQNYGGPRPVMAMRAEMAKVPMEAGEQTIEAGVSITWTIAD